jgi:hypothetical protein
MKVGVLATTMFALLIGFPIASFAGLAPDADGDGIPDVLDKCSTDSRNATAPATCDNDTDGYGNTCDADFNQDFVVNATDFGMFFVPAFKGSDPAPWPQGMDMDCSGAVNATDFGMFFVPKFKNLPPGSNKPGPSGLACAGTPGCS